MEWFQQEALVVDLVESMFKFGSPPFIELREKIWLEVFSEAVQANLDGLIFTFAYDRTVRSSFIENTRGIIETSGGEIFFVELTCSGEELERRIAHPSRKSFGKINSVDWFRELQKDGAFVDPGISGDRLVVDTTALSASNTAHLIASKLGSKLSRE